MAAEHDEDPAIEFSPLCQSVTEDDITVQLRIYRVAGEKGGWSLEVVDHEGASTVWNEQFATDRSAYVEFQATIAAEGIEAFLVPPARALH